MQIAQPTKDQKLQKLIISHLNDHPAKMAKFQELTGRTTPEAYFREFSYKDDIGHSVASDLNLQFQAKRLSRPTNKPISRNPQNKQFDPFNL
jgi:hypothetical protein